MRWKKIVFNGNNSVPVLRAPRGILMAYEKVEPWKEQLAEHSYHHPWRDLKDI